MRWLTNEHGFDTDDRTYVARVHDPDRDRWLAPTDGRTVGEALLDLIRADLDALAESGILDPDSGFEADRGHVDEPDEQPADNA